MQQTGVLFCTPSFPSTPHSPMWIALQSSTPNYPGVLECSTHGVALRNALCTYMLNPKRGCSDMIHIIDKNRIRTSPRLSYFESHAFLYTPTPLLNPEPTPINRYYATTPRDMYFESHAILLYCLALLTRKKTIGNDAEVKGE